MHPNTDNFIILKLVSAELFHKLTQSMHITFCVQIGAEPCHGSSILCANQRLLALIIHIQYIWHYI